MANLSVSQAVLPGLMGSTESLGEFSTARINLVLVNGCCRIGPVDLTIGMLQE